MAFIGILALGGTEGESEEVHGQGETLATVYVYYGKIGKKDPED